MRPQRRRLVTTRAGAALSAQVSFAFAPSGNPIKVGTGMALTGALAGGGFATLQSWAALGHLPSEGRIGAAIAKQGRQIMPIIIVIVINYAY